MDLTNEDVRRKELGTRPQAEVAEILAKLSPGELVSISRAAVAALNVYEIALVKEERVGSKVLPAQTLRVMMRESPRAARIEFVEGPSKGRKVLYNEQIKKDEMRVKEGGALGLAGAIWIRLDNPLARTDTRRRVTDLGYGPLLAIFEKDLERSAPHGGHSRKDLGFDARGMWSMELSAPPGALGLDADRARITLNLVSGLPVEVETHDKGGLLERHGYQLLRSKVEVPPDFFVPKAFGL
jgi:hypothetical protein